MVNGVWVNGVDEDDVDPDLALLDDPIIGVERIVSTQDGPGALEAKPLSTPPSMTPAAFAVASRSYLTQWSRYC